MKKIIPHLLLVLVLSTSCKEGGTELLVDKTTSDTDSKSYWYNGEAEISSYQLTQARYGEEHNGTAVLVFVTEPFSMKNYVKADQPSGNDPSVMKLNFTKKFNTGIYPYSMMTSTFFPFEKGDHSLKISSSSQEWCGHTYMELKNKKQFEIKLNSYFEGESNENITLDKDYLEDDFWSMIRLKPDQLPTGKQKVIPSFFYLRLLHKEAKAYECELSIINKEEGVNTYKIVYPELDREMNINFEAKFPHEIISWEETYFSGWGASRKELTTSAKLIKTLKSDYWNKHNNIDANLRKQLGLDK